MNPTSDSEGHDHEVHVNTVSPTTRFDFDDAFSDGEDHYDNDFNFNKDAIRQEFAKYHPASDLEPSWGNRDSEDDVVKETLNGSFETQPADESDTSVSTIDINCSGSPHASSSSQSRTPEDSSEHTSQFSSVSLSEMSHGNHERTKVEGKADIEEVEVVVEDGDGENDLPYPMVHIDASEERAARVNEAPVVALSHPFEQSAIRSPSPSDPNRIRSFSVHDSHAPQTQTWPHPEATASPTSSPSTGHSGPQRGHRPTRSVGPSMMEKVISKTRPTHLPPKSKQEDNKHLADWSMMMKQSRAAEEKRRKSLSERRLARERQIEESLHIWEKELVPDWRAVYKNPRLRKLWWSGIPTNLRAGMWERAVGNALALSKDNYRSCLARAKRAFTNGAFPADTLALIDQDIECTLPSLHIFHPETGPLYQDLRDILCAWVVSRSDEGLGYTFGVAKIAAMFIINMPPQQAFTVMRNLLERHCMRSFYGGMASKDDVDAYYRIFDTLLADGMPKIYFNFKQHQISPAAYLPDWLLPLFLDHLPFEACARVWDVLLLEGDSFLYRAALAVLAVLESRLFFPDRRELLELLKGENKAALDVALRDGRPLNGGKYEIYGVDEETLWERINGMDEWWKESTWTRLIQRELPDI